MGNTTDDMERPALAHAASSEREPPVQPFGISLGQLSSISEVRDRSGRRDSAPRCAHHPPPPARRQAPRSRRSDSWARPAPPLRLTRPARPALCLCSTRTMRRGRSWAVCRAPPPRSALRCTTASALPPTTARTQRGAGASRQLPPRAALLCLLCSPVKLGDPYCRGRKPPTPRPWPPQRGVWRQQVQTDSAQELLQALVWQPEGPHAHHAYGSSHGARAGSHRACSRAVQLPLLPP